MADVVALSDTIQELIQGAAATALSPFCDPNDDDWRDAAADQIRDAVVVAFSDAGLEVVRPICDVAPKTVYMGGAFDQFVTTWERNSKRVIVVERSDA